MQVVNIDFRLKEKFAKSNLNVHLIPTCSNTPDELSPSTSYDSFKDKRSSIEPSTPHSFLSSSPDSKNFNSPSVTSLDSYTFEIEYRNHLYKINL